MLTRLRIKGFKNLADVDVRFGPFTCIAGANGVGKSNLFDAITFLSALADKPLMDAARGVRDERGRSTDVRTLFMSLGDRTVEEMSFEAEMLVPGEGEDDLGQRATATITFLRYELILGLRSDGDEKLPSEERLEIKREVLDYINLGEAKSHLRFPHAPTWRKSVVKGKRFGSMFLSTDEVGDNRVVKLHQDGGGGRPRSLLAAQLPRTVLSTANAVESSTALLARREMQSWRLLQFEPSALRASDAFTSPPRIGADGSHLAATLYHLSSGSRKGAKAGSNGAVFARVANRLSELIDDVRSVSVLRDERRELFTLCVTDRENRMHAARALSDGTLRFLALAILELDPHALGLLCLEEPENGIHPARIPALLRLLRDLAVDVTDEAGLDNPLRQVIVNTHSPVVVGNVADADLLMAVPRESIVASRRCPSVGFTWLEGTWRHAAAPDIPTTSRGQLHAYLNPLRLSETARELQRDSEGIGQGGRRANSPIRVADRDDLQLELFAASE